MKNNKEIINPVEFIPFETSSFAELTREGDICDCNLFTNTHGEVFSQFKNDPKPVSLINPVLIYTNDDTKISGLFVPFSTDSTCYRYSARLLDYMADRIGIDRAIPARAIKEFCLDRNKITSDIE